MAALGALLIQAAWSTMAGRPLALAAFNAFFTFGTAFGLDIHLNFFDRALAAAPTFSPKDIVLNGFYGASSLSSRDDVSLSKALVTVLFPAAASVIEPFWFTRDQNSSIVFGPCQLSGPGSSVGSSSSALPVSQDSSGGPAGRRGCSRDGNGMCSSDYLARSSLLRGVDLSLCYDRSPGILRFWGPSRARWRQQRSKRRTSSSSSSPYWICSWRCILIRFLEVYTCSQLVYLRSSGCDLGSPEAHRWWYSSASASAIWTWNGRALAE